MALCAALLLCLSLRVSAQDAPSITLQEGDVFEIMAVSDSDALYSWVLLKDQTFVEAGRDHVFHVRLTEPGDYQLEAAADFPSTGDRQRRSFVLHVNPRDPSSEPAERIFVDTTPALTSGYVALDPTNDIVTLTPSETIQGDLHLDTDTQKDSDGDGDPTNDRDAEDALFRAEKNALHVWFTQSAAVHTIRVFAPDNGDPQDATITIRKTQGGESSEQPAPAPAVTGDINVTPFDLGQARFTFPLEQPLQDLLYLWDFGDGEHSLVNAPVHHYLRDGDYDVQVSVRSLRNGNEIGVGRKTITISNSAPVMEASSSSESAMSSSEAAGTVSSAGSSSSTGAAWWTWRPDFQNGTLILILQILGVGIGAIVLGAAVTWIALRFLRRPSSLQKGIEEAEARLMGKGAPSSSIDVPPPPMQLRRSEPVVDAVVQERPPEVEHEDSVYPDEPKVDMETAPAWLKQGLTGQTVSAPEPTPAAPAPEPAPVLTPEPQATPEPMPWDLPASPATPIAEAAAPQPPAPLSEPISEPVTPQPVDENMPAWLQGDAPAPVSEPTPVSEPAPVPAPEPTPAPPPVIEQPVESIPAQPEPVLAPVAEAPVPPAPAAEPELPAAAPAPESVPPFEFTTPSPAPIETQPVPVEPAPAPAPAPVPEPQPAVAASPVVPEPAPIAPVVASTPIATSPVVPVPVTPAPAASVASVATPAAAPSAEDQARLERERERKRKKRQRYRDNLKKRQETAPAPIAPALSPVAPAPQAATPMIPTPAIATPLPSVTVPPVSEQQEAEMLAQQLQTQPTPASAAPVAQQPATPATDQNAPKADDQVAFLIRADSVEPPPAPPQEGETR